MSNFYHIPVLLQEVIEHMQIQEGKKYIDGTIGGGGHTAEILKRGGKVLGIDQDPEAVQHIHNRFKNEKNVTLAQDNFVNMQKVAQKHGFVPADGILLDLGISSHQLNSQKRGFAHRYDAPLDMRMGGEGTTAGDIVNTYSKEDLTRVIAKNAELVHAEDIAQKIVQARKKETIQSTQDLIDTVTQKVHLNGQEKARLFQALRMETNKEIEALSNVLPKTLEILCKGGRLIVISFHSGEDRVVKEWMKEAEKQKKGKIITKKPIIATDEELQKNRRAKSAKMRVLELT